MAENDRTRHLEARIMVHGRPAGVVRLSVGQRVTLDTPRLRKLMEGFCEAVGRIVERDEES